MAWKKKGIVLGLAGLLAAGLLQGEAETSVAANASSGGVSLTLNGWEVELQNAPFLEGGSVYLPLREINGLLNSRTTWFSEGKRIVVNNAGTHLAMKLGSAEATVNGKPYKLTALPKLVRGTVYVPIRFVSEALGAQVVWTAKEKRVDLEHENDYLFAEKGTRGYWVHRNTGELYVSEDAKKAELVADTRVDLHAYGELSVSRVSGAVDLLTIAEEYGEPSLNEDRYGIVLANGAAVLETKAHYWGVHPNRSLPTAANGNLLLLDGATLYEVDGAGAVAATHDLQALTGYKDEAFQVEYYEDEWMAVRPHTTGWLTLIERSTGETERLIDAFATEEQLEALEELQRLGPNDFEFQLWDGLKAVGRDGNKLLLKHTFFLQPNRSTDVVHMLE
ncbi:copper amine oxidase N-terminal domain-containing protein [Paenibacillus sp. TRM 82003]|nr:copper amine oxidase N-terminal domain-containing protein [Paenibacillus sp. TRM 82003]